jgi:putative OPT family oligopeptide transporter
VDAQPAHKIASDLEPAFRPFVSPRTTIRELTARGVILGSILGILFAASSVYLGLKVGLTVSASIPVAVLSITLFKWLGQIFKLPPATILENNIVQTTGSAGESIAAGVAFTLPSLLLMGFDMETSRILTVALLGGLIGVLMMIPLRQGLIVQEHGRLMYPEGTACADVLIVGEKGGTSAKTVFIGFFSGLAYACMNLILRLWADVSTFAVDFWGKLRGGTLAFEVSPAMLGVGYIIGPRTSANMMAGGMLAFLILIPLVHIFGDAAPAALFPATKRISDLTPGEIRNHYILYVGAGAVATGGFIALARAIPTILGAFAGGMRSLRSGSAAHSENRTERDLPMTFVLGGCLAIALAIGLAPILDLNALTAVLIVLFGFFFVTVSSRITGEIGSSSNPISGMTVATLLITCGIFVLLGWTGVGHKAMALTAASLVCVAAANGGTISQDLKTGFLVGATPRAQQIAILIGVITSAIVIGFTLQLLNRGSTTYKPIDAGDVALAEISNAQMTAPDSRSYRVAYVREDITHQAATGEIIIPRGKYLVDDGGRPLYLVDPGVCGTYPQRNEPVSPGGSTIAVPLDAPVELGADRRPYRRVELDASSGGYEAGTYLVDESGRAAYHVRPTGKFDAPKAQLFRLIIDGTLGGTLPWGLVLIGVFLAIMMELVGVSSLPFAVGLYLPISTSGGVFTGGVVRWLVDRKRKGAAAAEAEFSPGMLMASGLIAGGAITGVLQSMIAVREAEGFFDLSGRLAPLSHNETWWPLFPFLVLALALYWVGKRGQKAA